MRDNNLIIQWFEGTREAVNQLWLNIQRDTRHHCIVQLIHRQDASKRLFEHWSLQTASRNEMIAIIGQARQQAEKLQGDDSNPWRHAISTLSILLDPDLSALYSQATQAPSQKTTIR